MIKKQYIVTSLCSLIVGGWAIIAQANPQYFVGTWVNTDSNTRGITRIIVNSAKEGSLSLQVFGQCHPTDCDWGVTRLVTYGASVQDTDHTQATATYHQGFANNLLTLQVKKSDQDNSIYLHSFTQFTDGSNRQNYAYQASFRRAIRLPPQFFEKPELHRFPIEPPKPIPPFEKPELHRFPIEPPKPIPPR